MADPPEARAEVARRFLHCYGPATPQRFAEWTEAEPGRCEGRFPADRGRYGWR
ncbi:MAG: DNA glycosylase AlkZ-like family protein [Actinomycetota bacterium]